MSNQLGPMTPDTAPDRFAANAARREAQRSRQREEAAACAALVLAALRREAERERPEGSEFPGLSRAQLSERTGYGFAALELAMETHLAGRLRGVEKGQVEYFTLKEEHAPQSADTARVVRNF